MKKTLRKITALIILVIGGYFFNENQTTTQQQDTQSSTSLEKLYQNHVSGEIITIKAKIIKLLADDNDGDRHQKMILKIGNKTLLLAHNIDVAKRVPAKKGDSIKVRGQYEWNEKGGIIHWTHKDRNNKHPHGWIKHNNKTYQ